MDFVGQRLAHYEIVESLGKGAMASVFKARDTKLERFVALKVLPAVDSPEQETRFAREARAISALNHPNIATIYSFERDGDVRFLSLEYISGGTLQQKLQAAKDSGRLLTPEEVVDCTLQIARGLAHAHSKGVIHRDIKASNILLAEDGALKVTDFGVAKLEVESTLTEEGSLLGTMAYMAPEQILGESVDHRADIFSFGVLAYEIATAELPFQTFHQAALHYEILNSQAPPIKELRQDLPERLERIIGRCLEKDPGRRYQSLNETVRELEELRDQYRSGSGSGWSDVTTTETRSARPEAGETLGRYKLLEKIGEGGMGTVFQAEDTRLGRKVAIKALKTHAVLNPERRRRFLLEARAASALNHPNIVAIHEIDEAGGVSFIVMEHVAGERLDRKIGERGLPVGEALGLALQIADALAAAHGAGIVHRDLKPANIIVTPEGRAKLLDFGLAKLTEPEPEDPSETPQTEEGAVLGTVAYMSPEQAEGRQLDARSDIFAFGSLLFEMLTGRRAFRGESKVSVLAAIVQQPPPSARELAPHVPFEIEKIVERCLRKAPERRFQSAADLKVAVEDVLEDFEEQRLITPLPSWRSWTRPALGAAAAAGALTVALAWALWAGLGPPWQQAAPPNAAAARQLELFQVTASEGLASSPDWSPDGEWIVYASDRSGSWDLWKKPVAGGEEVQLSSSPDIETQPAWSPDGRTIVFAKRGSESGLFLMPADGGAPVSVASFGANPAWSPDGRRLAFDWHGAIYLVGSSGGEPEEVVGGTSGTPHVAWGPNGGRLFYWDRTGRDIFSILLADRSVTKLDLISTGEDVAGLTVSGDGRWLVYSKGAFGGDKNLWSVRLDADEGRPRGIPRRLTVSATDDIECRFSQDGARLAFVVRRLDRQLWAWTLDPGSGLPSGQARLVTLRGRRNYYPAATADGSLLVWTSQNAGQGALYYQQAGEGQARKLTRDWDRSVREVGATLSPDGGQIAYASTVGGAYQLWRMPALDSVALQLTEAERPQSDSQPEWSSDGSRLAFYSNRSGNWDIWTIPAEGGTPQQLLDWKSNELYPAWAPDGQALVFLSDREGNPDLWRLDLASHEVTRFISDPAVEGPGRWSPDGSRFYFISNRDGDFGLWVMPGQGGEARKVGASHGSLSLPESPLFAKFAVTDNELILPLESREGDVYVLEGVEELGPGS